MAQKMLTRRAFVRRAVQVAVAGGALGIGAATLGPIHGPVRKGAQPVLLRAEGTADLARPVSLADLAGAPVTMAKGEWNGWGVLVVKVRRETLEAARRVRGRGTDVHAVDHPEEPEHVLLAYRDYCKHLGCMLDWAPQLGASKDVQDYDGDGAPDGRILCPCHQAQYDVFDLGKNVPGTRGREPLDIVRIRIDDGKVVGIQGIRQG